jgi:hypothetical protein
MTATVHNIADAKPHAVLDCTRVGGAVHVVPLEYFLGIVNEREGIDPLPADIVRELVWEWLETRGLIEEVEP